MIRRRILFYLVILFIIADLVITFQQYLRTAIDGDVVPIVLPVPTYAKILTDPFATDAVFKGSHYTGAGRYSCHELMNLLFRSGYGFLNEFTADRINALYLTAAIFQWICNWLMAAAFSLYINIKKRFEWKYFIYAIALTIPFFQYHHGYTNDQMIDRAVTYTAFYAFPITVLLFFFYPFFRSVFYDQAKPVSGFVLIIQGLLGAFLVFSGPLIPVIGCLFFLLLFVFYQSNIMRSANGEKNKYFRHIPIKLRVAAAIFIPLWLYSFYARRFNVENATDVGIAE